MKKHSFYEIGKQFYDWLRTGKLQFVYGDTGKDAELELARILELIEYTSGKKETLKKSK
jgi:hypothetical protein